MILTLSELHNNSSKTLKFTLDFNKEINESSSFTNIRDVAVVGNFFFIEDLKIEFYFEVSLLVTILAADTNNPIDVPMHIVIDEVVSEDEDSEYKINNGRIDLYELIWGWVAAELPDRQFEHN